MIIALLVVCAGAYYAWYMLFSTSVGGTSVVGSPVDLASSGDGESGTGGGRAPGDAAGGISDEVARSTFKSFAMAMARDDPDTACAFSAYRGQQVAATDLLDDCRTKVEEEVDSLSDAELAALSDSLRSATYTASGNAGDGGVGVSTTVLGETLSGTVVDAGGQARVELTSLARQ